jgi:hypothetical protein
MIKKLDENKFKLGKWAGLIGGIMLILTGLIGLVDYRDFFFENLIFSVPYFLTLFWGVIALIGVLYLHRNNDFGDNLLIYAGALAIFGMFFPIFIYEIDSGVTFIIYLSYHFGYIDPFLVLFGGIIDLLVRKEIIWA